jgi:hypothetical protein
MGVSTSSPRPGSDGVETDDSIDDADTKLGSGAGFSLFAGSVTSRLDVLSGAGGRLEIGGSGTVYGDTVVDGSDEMKLLRPVMSSSERCRLCFTRTPSR